MKNLPPLKRKNYLGHRILVGILIVLVAAIGLFAYVKRAAVYRYFHPELIEFRDYSSIKSDITLDSLYFTGAKLEENPDGSALLTYSAHDDALNFKASFRQDRLETLEARMVIDKMRVNGIEDAIILGDKLFSPYFEKYDREALIFTLASRLIPYATNPDISIDCSVGNIGIRIRGSATDGIVDIAAAPE